MKKRIWTEILIWGRGISVYISVLRNSLRKLQKWWLLSLMSLTVLSIMLDTSWALRDLSIKVRKLTPLEGIFNLVICESIIVNTFSVSHLAVTCWWSPGKKWKIIHHLKKNILDAWIYSSRLVASILIYDGQHIINQKVVITKSKKQESLEL